MHGLVKYSVLHVKAICSTGQPSTCLAGEPYFRGVIFVVYPSVSLSVRVIFAIFVLLMAEGCLNRAADGDMTCIKNSRLMQAVSEM